jgi:ATP-dependent protease HslVU (ClpYQ) peptidase subunit
VTTIATDGKTMASDSQIVLGGLRAGSGKKVRSVRGHIVGTSGEHGDGVIFCDWFEKGALLDERPDLAGDFHAMTLDKEGKILVYDSDCVPFHASGFFAIGSGSDFALGAMAKGATPFEAVKIAAEFDINTGGMVNEMARDGSRIA